MERVTDRSGSVSRGHGGPAAAAAGCGAVDDHQAAVFTAVFSIPASVATVSFMRACFQKQHQVLICCGSHPTTPPPPLPPTSSPDLCAPIAQQNVTLYDSSCERFSGTPPWLLSILVAAQTSALPPLSQQNQWGGGAEYEFLKSNLPQGRLPQSVVNQ